MRPGCLKLALSLLCHRVGDDLGSSGRPTNLGLDCDATDFVVIGNTSLSAWYARRRGGATDESLCLSASGSMSRMPLQTGDQVALDRRSAVAALVSQAGSDS